MEVTDIAIVKEKWLIINSKTAAWAMLASARKSFVYMQMTFFLQQEKIPSWELTLLLPKIVFVWFRFFISPPPDISKYDANLSSY